jgi:hypothetical protein
MFVLDASVALRWLLNDARAADRKYCDAVMEHAERSLGLLLLDLQASTHHQRKRIP